jgi:uncharacterized membrane protein YhaH (DUF805 family)
MDIKRGLRIAGMIGATVALFALSALVNLTGWSKVMDLLLGLCVVIGTLAILIAFIQELVRRWRAYDKRPDK